VAIAPSSRAAIGQKPDRPVKAEDVFSNAYSSKIMPAK
jgi:hypothetical protein